MRSPCSRRRRAERGSMAVEMVILVPVLMMFVLLIVAFGRYISVQGDIEASARDAARIASQAASFGEAQAQARDIAGRSLDEGTTCRPAGVGGNWAPGGEVTVTLACDVSYDGLGLIGLPGSVSIDATSAAPLDRYRRFS